MRNGKLYNVNKILLLVISIVPVLALSGCTNLAISVESLLTPPRMSSEQTEIYQALINSKGNNIRLKYPKSGDYLSAFVVQNIDDEPTEEAIVFYQSSNKTDENTLRINFLDYENEQWVSVYDVPATGTEIECVMFEQFSGSNKINIIFGCSGINQTDKVISIYNYESRIPTEIYRGTYSYVDVFDPDNDGENELFFVTYNAGLGYSTANLLAWQDNVFTLLSSCPLNAAASSFSSIKIGKVAENDIALFLDFVRGDGSYGTEVLFCNGKNLVNPQVTTNINRRTNSITPILSCFDIDNDGIVEIPSTTPLPGYENLTKPEQMYRVTWYNIVDRFTLQKKFTTLFNSKGNYIFKMPTRWDGLVTITISSDGRTIDFVQYDSAMSQLLSIAAVPNGTVLDSSSENSGYSLYQSNTDTGFDYYIRHGDSSNSLILTDSELADCFIFLTGIE